MNGLAEFLVWLVMVVGLVGVLLPVLPGLALIGAVAVFWGFEVGTVQGWLVVAAMVAVLVAGTVVKYRIPGREMAEAEVSTRTWVLAGLLAVIGFFVVPVIGLALGFVLGTYVGERRERGGHEPAWAATRRLLEGIGKGIVVEFTSGAIAITAWSIAAIAM